MFLWISVSGSRQRHEGLNFNSRVLIHAAKPVNENNNHVGRVNVT